MPLLSWWLLFFSANSRPLEGQSAWQQFCSLTELSQCLPVAPSGRISKSTESRVTEMGKYKFPKVVTGGQGKRGHSCFYLLVLRPLHYTYWDMVPYMGLWLAVRTVFRMMAHYSCKAPFPRWRSCWRLTALGWCRMCYDQSWTYSSIFFDVKWISWLDMIVNLMLVNQKLWKPLDND